MISACHTNPPSLLALQRTLALALMVPAVLGHQLALKPTLSLGDSLSRSDLGLVQAGQASAGLPALSMSPALYSFGEPPTLPDTLEHLQVASLRLRHSRAVLLSGWG